MVVDYGGGHRVGPFSLQLGAGEFVALIGPNGVGKSTFVRGVLGLLSFKSGEVAWPQGKEAVSYIPQRARLNADVPCTLREFLDLQGIEADRVEGWLEASGILTGLLDRSVHTLSGGTLQKLFLAMAIHGRPRVIVLDEGLEGLDVAAQEQAYRGLAERVAAGALVVMITHDITAVTSRAHRVICMGSELLYDGSPASPQFHSCLHQLYGDSAHIHDHSHVLAGKK